MKKAVIFATFALGAGFGGISAGAIADAAVGDLIVEAKNTERDVEVTAEQAATLTDGFIAVGAWDGDRGSTTKCGLWTTAVPATEEAEAHTVSHAECTGLKTIAAKDIDGPMRIVGKVVAQ